jgi:putative transposase
LAALLCPFFAERLGLFPRKADDDCLTELRWFYERRNVEEARRDLVAWLAKWQAKYPKLCQWVENNIEETFSFYRLPKEHHKHLKSTNVLERLIQELKRRTQVIRIFPNEASVLRLVRALAVEIHENWLETPRYLIMEALREQQRNSQRTSLLTAA